MQYTIYSKPSCPQCDQAKNLLTSRSIPYNEVVLDVGQNKLENKTYISVSEIKALFPNAKTAPIILKNGVFIGGFNQLREDIK